MKGCYLLHFARPLGNGKQRHYIGWSTDIRRRCYEHVSGTGSDLTRAAISAGIDIRVARVWLDAGKDVELKLKRRGSRALCPCCHLENAETLMYSDGAD